MRRSRRPGATRVDSPSRIVTSTVDQSGKKPGGALDEAKSSTRQIIDEVWNVRTDSRRIEDVEIRCHAGPDKTPVVESPRQRWREV